MTTTSHQKSPRAAMRLAVVGAGLVGRRHIETIQQSEAVERCFEHKYVYARDFHLFFFLD